MIENDKKIGELLPKDGIPSINVNCIERSPNGVMWVGTDVGVVRYPIVIGTLIRFCSADDG